MSVPSMQPPSPNVMAVVVRIAVLLALVIAATWLAHVVRDALDLRITPANEQQVHRALMIGAVAYVGLVAVPFVPGAEIGLAMLAAFGAAIAPLVYFATILALTLSYTLGRLLPIAALARLLATLRLRRASTLVTRAAPLPHDERLALLLHGAPPRLLALVLRRRYIALALALNTPGNALIGGGGGIALLAGMSRLFAPLPTLLTFALAVSPVPIVFLAMGT